MTAAIAPLAPKLGTVEVGPAATCAAVAARHPGDRKRDYPRRPMRSSISGPKAHRKTMLPRICDQLPCMNIDVRS